jgi:uncharacterized protein YbaR (Trm112 family)
MLDDFFCEDCKRIFYIKNGMPVMFPSSVNGFKRG